MAEKKTEMIGNESELNSLFKETLDGLRDDLIEADDNCRVYLNAINNETGGKELWGQFYNEALKIKGACRARSLQFLNSYKDRVAVKEKMLQENRESGNVPGMEMDHGKMNEYMKLLKESMSEKTVPFINPKSYQDDNGTEENDYQ